MGRILLFYDRKYPDFLRTGYVLICLALLLQMLLSYGMCGKRRLSGVNKATEATFFGVRLLFLRISSSNRISENGRLGAVVRGVETVTWVTPGRPASSARAFPRVNQQGRERVWTGEAPGTEVFISF